MIEQYEKLFKKYTQEVDCYLSKTRRRRSPPDERLMRLVETQLDIPEQGCDDFRRSIMAFIGHLYMKGKPVTWDCHPQLKRAIINVALGDRKWKRAVAMLYLTPNKPHKYTP
jgi:predicted Ser/Thr protein kinase